jgi:hypothetical protein
VLDEFYRVAFRKTIYRTIEELQTDLDAWIKQYHEQRPHQGRWCKSQDADANLCRQLEPWPKEKLITAYAASDSHVITTSLHCLSDMVLVTTP